jgi:hypothetical protein
MEEADLTQRRKGAELLFVGITYCYPCLHYYDVGSVVELCGFGLSVGKEPLDKFPVFIFHIAVSQPLKTAACAVFKATFAPSLEFIPV